VLARLQVPLILSDPLQRVAAAEAMGRLATAMGAGFVASLIKSLLETVLNNGDPSTRAGYILALGCVLRHVGGTGVSAHLQSTVGTARRLRENAGRRGWDGALTSTRSGRAVGPPGHQAF